MSFKIEKIIRQFVATSENDPVNQVIIRHSVLHYAGDVKGKSVLDLGCGSGMFSRAVKENGASEVLGIDLSKTMVDCAKREEGIKPLGIEYRLGDALNMGKIGEYDLVFTNRVFYYLNTIEDFEKCVQTIFDNLKAGGRFVGVQVNSFDDDWHDKLTQFKRNAEKIEDRPNCKVLKFSYTTFDMEDSSVIQYHYDLPTYQRVFKKVGFRSFTVNKAVIDERANKNFPEENLKDLLDTEFLIALVAEK